MRAPLFVASALTILAISNAAPARADAGLGILQGRIVSGEKLDGIEGATVVVSRADDGQTFVVSTMTGQNGKYSIAVLPGTYDILAVFGDSRWLHRNVPVEEEATTTVPGVLAVEPSEMITVHEHGAHESRAAEAIASTVKPRLPYSDEAVDQDAWAVGWMLLDVNDKGRVTSFRFLHRPGHDLNTIASKEVFSLRFKPALDSAANPMAVKVLWRLEWPAYWWSIDHLLVGTAGLGALTSSLLADHLPGGSSFNGGARILNASYVGDSFGFFLPGDYFPPCANSGQPWNMDTSYAGDRDCSKPDFSSIDREPLITAPPR